MKLSLKVKTPHRNRAAGATLAASAMLAVAAVAAVAAAVAAPAATPPDGAPSTPVPVKVMVVNMFSLEAAPWLDALKPQREFRVPGMPRDYPLVRCNDAAVCELTTGMGHANAAATLMALIYSGWFDLHRTYFLIAGIAGIDPAHGGIGAATWARYAIDMGIAHEIDARELPAGWQDGYFGVLTDAPDVKPPLEYRSEVYRLNEALLQRALTLSAHAALEDSPDARAYRQHYPSAPANGPPQVLQCDTITDDAWWAGARLGEHASRWTRLLTDGAGDFCSSQQEDNATLTALTRGAQSGLLDFQRIAVLRTASDFDRPYPHQSTLDSLRDQRVLAGALRISTDNLVRAGMPLVDAIVQDWDHWQDGVPAAMP